MGKSLVIVESPAKAKTINKILGGNFIVKSSMGHVRDLPVKNFGIDIRNSFKPSYSIVKGRKKVVEELKKAAEQCGDIYLAPDPDREGEAIAWHLKHVLSRGDKADHRFLRVQYNEITPRAVKEAFSKPGEIDLNKVNAQQARRILDRIVGYTISPVLWRRIRRGLSAGRVQSVALRLVCEREDEIGAFVPEEYWIIGARARKLVDPRDEFVLRLVRVNGEKPVIDNEQKALAARGELEGRRLRVHEISTREMKRRAPPPYITSSLQQAGSSYCGLSPNRTMSIAQKLYEGVDFGEGPVGLITYMRTDSFNLSRDAVEACRAFIRNKYGDEYCPQSPVFFKSRSGAQGAHEAIRPTDVNRTPESLAGHLGPAELKIYRLIWQRFVACQMLPAVLELLTVKVDAVAPQAGGNTYLLQASTSRVRFPGYMKVAGMEVRKKEEEPEHQDLPPLSEGEDLECMEWTSERKETQPPPRYSEASLVKMLENKGIGRPSTYAQTISTLYNRTYIVKEGKQIIPTGLGRSVTKLLVENLGELFDVGFTAGMEALLDDVESGTVEWTRMLGDFHQRFEKWMANVAEPPADAKTVQRLVETLQTVRNWGEEIKRGKSTYSDKAFVASIATQLTEGKKAISVRQLEALARMVCKYKSQIAEAERILKEEGLDRFLAEDVYGPPREITVKKMEILKDLELPPSARKFVDSLQQQLNTGRRLSEAQINALDNVFRGNASLIEGFEEIREGLGIKKIDIENDNESGVMLKAMSGVQNWRDPVKRGNRIFDDKAFYTSLTEHFSRKNYLSFKQRNALRKMVKKYKDEIPDAEKLLAGLKETPSEE